MTAAALDPGAVIAAAGREFVDSIRQLVDRDHHDDVPGLLDEVSKILRRARGRVSRATKPATDAAKPPTPAAPKPQTPAPKPATPTLPAPAVTTPQPRPAGHPAPVATHAEQRPRTVTLPIPPATPTGPRHRKTRQPEKPMAQPQYAPRTYAPERRGKFVVPAWLALSFGITGCVFIPVPILNNATALLAFVGVICAIVALFGSRKLVATIGLVLCLGGIIGTIAMQQHWTKQLDQIEKDIRTP